MWFWRKRATPLPAAQQVRKASRAVIEGLERRCLMSVTSVSIDTGDYVAPGPGDSNGPTPGSMVERISGFSGSFTFHTDHDDPSTGGDGGLAYVTINYGDFMGPIQPQLMTAGTHSIGHTYDEDGTYVMSVTVEDTTTPSSPTYSGWQGTSNSATAELQVSDGQLAVVGDADSSFDPNSTINQPVAYFADEGVPDLNDYTGTIDWGDGTTTSATFAMADGGAVAVWGSHTYTYETDPDTGVAFPLTGNEQAQYNVKTHIVDSGGSTLDCITLMQANLRPHLAIDTWNNPDHHGVALVNLSIAAGTGTINIQGLDGRQNPLVLTPPLTVTVTPRQASPTLSYTIAQPDGVLQTHTTITFTYTATASDLSKSYDVRIVDGAGVAGKVVLTFVA